MRSDRSGATQGRPRSHAHGPKTAPAKLKTAPRGPKKPPEAPRRAWDRFPSDFRAMLGSPGPRKPQKVLYCQRISWFSRFRKGAFNRGPQTFKRSPPNEPQARPERPQERKDGSRSRPERAKRRPRPPRSAPGEDPRGPKPPRRLQGALPEPVLASSWAPRGLIFEPSRRPCRASRTVYHTHESTVRNHWSKALS